MDEIMIEAHGIKRCFRLGSGEDFYALKGIDITVPAGKLTILKGRSGSGKTTLLNILSALDEPTEGEVIVGGHVYSEMNEKEKEKLRRYNIGFVFQFYNLVQNLTVRENVELATQICKNPLDVDEVIEAVGLKERSSNFPAQLSGGEQQRVAIARALAKNPKLLLCDEPTGALDYNTGKQILKLLQDTCRERGVTVVVITHNLALTAMGDKVIKVKNGVVDSVTVNENPLPIEQIEW